MNFLEKVKTFCATGGTRRVTLVEISHIVFVSKLHHFSCKTNRLAYKIEIITNIKRGKQIENKRNRFIFPKL
jgi:hypothetical protein